MEYQILGSVQVKLGYTKKFQVLVGSDNNSREIEQVQRVPTNLTKDMNRKGYYIYTDKFYISEAAAGMLL